MKGLNWEGGAIANAVWSGARLYDVLKYCGLKDLSKIRHVQVTIDLLIVELFLLRYSLQQFCLVRRLGYRSRKRSVWCFHSYRKTYESILRCNLSLRNERKTFNSRSWISIESCSPRSSGSSKCQMARYSKMQIFL